MSHRMRGDVSSSRESQGLAMHASLTTGRLGSDMAGPGGFSRGNSSAVQVECESEKQMRGLCAKLSAGGEATYLVSAAFWGGLYGQLTDRFGTRWMLSFAQGWPPQKARSDPMKLRSGSPED